MRLGHASPRTRSHPRNCWTPRSSRTANRLSISMHPVKTKRVRRCYRRWIQGSGNAAKTSESYHSPLHRWTKNRSGRSTTSENVSERWSCPPRQNLHNISFTPTSCPLSGLVPYLRFTPAARLSPSLQHSKRVPQPLATQMSGALIYWRPRISARRSNQSPLEVP